jgi:hypothetical protein
VRRFPKKSVPGVARDRRGLRTIPCMDSNRELNGMTKRICRAAARVAAIALAGMGAAHAQAPAYGPRSTAFANVFGPYVAGGQTSQVSILVVDGAIVPGSTYDSTGGSTQSWSHSADNFRNTAGVVGNTGNTATAISDLHTGSVGGSVTIGNGQIQRGFSQAEAFDTIYFNNSSGGTLYLPVAFGFDGVMTGPDITDFSSATATFTINIARSGCDVAFNNCLGGLSFPSGRGVGVGLNITYLGGGRTFATNFGDPNIDADFDVVDGSDPASGYRATTLASMLAIPTGYSLFGFRLATSIDCSSAFTVCDFSHTSLFDLGALPDGLSFTSASGVWQNAVPTPGGGVPEPSSWAMMIGGFGLAGAALRRAKRNGAVALVW